MPFYDPDEQKNKREGATFVYGERESGLVDCSSSTVFY